MEKGAFPCDTLKHNNTKTPKVHTTVVVSVLEHLRSLDTGKEGGRDGEREREREREREKGGGGGRRKREKDKPLSFACTLVLTCTSASDNTHTCIHTHTHTRALTTYWTVPTRDSHTLLWS